MDGCLQDRDGRGRRLADHEVVTRVDTGPLSAGEPVSEPSCQRWRDTTVPVCGDIRSWQVEGQECRQPPWLDPRGCGAGTDAALGPGSLLGRGVGEYGADILAEIEDG
jgi:hypothetical protein